MSRLYKGKFLGALERLIDERTVMPPAGTDVRAMFNALYQKDRGVYAKTPFGGSHAVI